MDEGIYALNAECEAMQNEIERLEAENAKLVNVLHEVEEDAVFAYHCLQSDIEHVMESETEFFEKWWRAECRNDNKLKRIEVLESENAKLREALAETLARLSAANEVAGGGFMDARYCELLSELGIEVA